MVIFEIWKLSKYSDQVICGYSLSTYWVAGAMLGFLTCAGLCVQDGCLGVGTSVGCDTLHPAHSLAREASAQ